MPRKNIHQPITEIKSKNTYCKEAKKNINFETSKWLSKHLVNQTTSSTSIRLNKHRRELFRRSK